VSTDADTHGHKHTSLYDSKTVVYDAVCETASVCYRMHIFSKTHSN